MAAQYQSARSQIPASRPAYLSPKRSILFPFALLAAVAFFALFVLMPKGSALAMGQESAGGPVFASQSTESALSGESGCAGWRIVPGADNNSGQIYGIDALTSNDIWAVGFRSVDVNGNPIPKTLVERWDGAQWSVVPSPNGGTEPYNVNTLRAVTAIASDDVWAIGRYGGNNGLPLALHWDGTDWSIVDTPLEPSAYNYAPADITAIASDDVWAVGQLEGPGGVLYQNWAIHWDGESWSQSPVPNPGTSYNYLFGVSGSASNDVWAVGIQSSGDTGGAALLHWDGASWQQTTYPAGIEGGAWGVKSFGPNDAWATGTFHHEQYDIDYPVALHYNGTAWEAVQMPTVPGFVESILFALDGSGPNDLWAVGVKRRSGFPKLVWSYHWDGTAWSEVYNPTPGNGDDGNLNIFAATSVGPGEVWLSGYHSNGPVIEQFSDPTSSCQLQFADVPPGNTFYQYAQCLACRSILSGYACGGEGEPCNPQNDPYFRPGNSITRGQLSKIISNAAQFSTDNNFQWFQDVAPDHTYFVPVQNLAIRDMIGGYACGGANEPCVPPYNLPYFRPGATATRAQIAKIASNAQYLFDDPGVRRFEDVPESDGFYAFVQRLANRGALGGYACGSASEPCVPPKNRPYFRPGNNASRGQLSKIVNVLFFTTLNP